MLKARWRARIVLNFSSSHFLLFQIQIPISLSGRCNFLVIQKFPIRLSDRLRLLHFLRKNRNLKPFATNLRLFINYRWFLLLSWFVYNLSDFNPELKSPTLIFNKIFLVAEEDFSSGKLLLYCRIFQIQNLTLCLVAEKTEEDLNKITGNETLRFFLFAFH